MSHKVNLSNQHGRVAIVDGVRTPFARIATHYRDLSAIDLGVFVVNEIIKRNDLKQSQIDQLVLQWWSKRNKRGPYSSEL